MNLNESMRILNITKNELPSLDEVKLRKIFHNKPLTMHPDKGGDNNNFINLKKAHDNLKSVVKDFLSYDGAVLCDFRVTSEVCMPLVAPGCALDDMILNNDSINHNFNSVEVPG